MAENNKPMISPKGQDPGFLQGLSRQLKLILRLMADNRVNVLLKILPIASFLYLISPFDFPGPIDDAMVIGFGLYTFVELCPKDIVAEHKNTLAAENNVANQSKSRES